MATAKLLDRTEGAQRLDRYELIGELASGGMATVFLARLAGVGGFQRFVAIKRLHPHLSSEPDFVQMFLDEARLAASIHHPHVVPILEVGTSDAGYYVVMEYVEGDTLSRVVARGASAGQKIPAGIALRVGLDTLAGLHAAHDLADDAGQPLGLVHRDVSPQNILVGVDGSARLTDFGVARASSRLATTQAGTLKGKLAYMPPEQAKGGELDRRADVFAMAIVLWEVLAGQRLFKGKSELETLNRLLFEPIPRLSSVTPEVPRALDDVLAKALNREVDARFSTAAEFADALERAAGSVSTVRDVAAYVKGVLGQEIEAQRAAVRAWLAAEPSQSAPTSSMVAMMAGGPSSARGLIGGPVSSTARHGAISDASAARLVDGAAEDATLGRAGRQSVSGPSSPSPSGPVSAPDTPAPRAAGARPGPVITGGTLASPTYDAPLEGARVVGPPPATPSVLVNEYEAGLKRRRPVVLLALVGLLGLGAAAVVTWKLLTAGATPPAPGPAATQAPPPSPASTAAPSPLPRPAPEPALPVTVDALPTAEPTHVPAALPGRPSHKPDTPKPDTPKPDIPTPDIPKPDTPKPDAPKPPPDDYKNPYR
ncbi:MAG: serine/threonine protein kinase [Polyangiaceae bacterium]|nr:serine/threonine protein kinase [Polyangiaceae bacterium]